MILLHVGRHATARRILERVLQINPGLTIARFRLAPISNYEQDFEETIVRGFMHFHHTAYSIGAVRAVLGDLASAERWVVRAANEGFPNRPFFEADVHLAPLRERPTFSAFLTRLRQEWADIPGMAN